MSHDTLPGNLPENTSPAAKRGLPWWLWPLGFAITATFLTLMYAAESQFRLGNNRLVTQLETVIATDLTPPGERAAWQPLLLPNSLYSGQLNKPFEGWAKITLADEFRRSSEPWLLVIPKPSGARFTLWLDDIELDARGSSHPQQRPRNPLLFSIPNPVLDDANQLTLRITHLGDRAYLNEIALGPTSELNGYANLVTLMQKSLTRAVVAMMFIMAFFMLVLHSLRRRSDTVYGWYALGLLAWVVHFGQTQIEVLPFGTPVFWNNLTFVTLATFIFTAAVFTNRVVRSPQPSYEWGLGVCWLLGAAFYLSSPVQDTNFVWITRYLWVPLMLVVGVYMVIRLANAAAQQRDSNLLILLTGTLVVFLVGVRDYLYNDLRLLPGSLLYFRFIAGFVLVAFSFVLIRRFAQALRDTEQLNRELAPIADITDEIQEYHTVLTQEHDELGTRINDLLSTISERNDLDSVRRSLNSAKNDLQLILDSLSSEGLSTHHLLNSLHQRLQLLAKEHNVELNWAVSEDFALLPLNPAELLVAARLLQSACHSAIVHADVFQVDVTARRTADSARLRIKVPDIETDLIFDNTRAYRLLADELVGEVAVHHQANEQTLSLEWPLPNTASQEFD